MNYLGLTSLIEYGVLFETGKKVTFRYAQNNEKIVNYGKTFAQDVEPAGIYLIHVPEHTPYLPNWTYGILTFSCPLVIKFHLKDRTLYDQDNWKRRLNRGIGKKHVELSKYLLRHHFDGIVTVIGKDTNEIVDIGLDFDVR